jgi:oxygen-independent coproporphyrinogen-3 oxidase
MLTVHDNTLLSKKVMTGKITMPDEDLCFSQYEFLISEVEKSGFQQYEISNFALAGFKSKHNIKYWKGYKYLGLGPAAHSYNLHSRAWNISDVESYVNDTSSFILQRVVEELPVKDMYNEFLMNSLRTTEGLNLTELEERFKRYGFCPLDKIEKLKKEWYHKEDNYIRLTTSGMFVSDYIIEKLMII